MKILFSKRFIRFALGFSFIIFLGLIGVISAKYFSEDTPPEEQSARGGVSE